MTKDKSIFIKNIYYMLSYAFTALKESVYDDIKKESFDNIHNLFAAVLAKGIGLQLKHGLCREYINRGENLPVVRGKIDMPGTMKNRLEHRMIVTCDYDELSENNLLNQILKSTVFLLLRQKDVQEKYKSELKKEMLFFSEVDQIELQHISWSNIRFQRNNRTYQLLLAICQLLIEGSLMTTESGEYRLAGFLYDQRMSRLYEKFVLKYYVQEFGQRIKGFSSRALQIPWQLDDGYDTLLPVMQTDITLTYGNQTLIIDAKYYEHSLQTYFDVQTLHSGNVYQIFTYVKNKQAELKDTGHQVSGMLLYAKTDEDLIPDNVYQMSGNQISVKTLDLSQEFPEIAGQLNMIVKEHFELALNEV
ncbi:MAG: 5-methylcytosine-specific restriction endonuclease system specificity protein McrC [Lachnospiraceae bacterium]|nr:5-methylcytosine-specific restriction endonuclease system specificity protein McrC [Lachnospiraceae bacterium]MCI1328382.1 5-methylcytosine-specific restriction endonuclease system specificity protein McrC [Lachnospiraceae bacterium]